MRCNSKMWILTIEVWFNLWFFVAWEMCHLKRCLSWSQNFTLHINKTDKAIQTKHSTFNVKPNDGLMKFSCMSNIVCPCGMWCRGKPMGEPCRRKRLVRSLRNGQLERPCAWILTLKDLYGLYRTVGLRGFEHESWNLKTCTIFVQ